MLTLLPKKLEHAPYVFFHVYEAFVAALADEVFDCPTNPGKPGRTVANRGGTVTPPAHTVTGPAVTGTAPWTTGTTPGLTVVEPACTGMNPG